MSSSASLANLFVLDKLPIVKKSHPFRRSCVLPITRSVLPPPPRTAPRKEGARPWALDEGDVHTLLGRPRGGMAREY